MLKLQESKKFFLILAFSSFVRILLAAIVPITGDEAYFILWAKNLNYGYYEHPPMIGWIMWLLSFTGNHIFIYRIFPIISIVAMAFIMVKTLSEIDRNKAYLCGTIFLLSPISVLNVLSVNDVPLIFFTFLSGIFFYRAVKTGKTFDAAIAGIFGGLAFLSKYFFAVFILAVLFFCIVQRKKEIWRITKIAAIAMLPFVAINIIWNYNNCWLNIMFNLFFRNKNMSINPVWVLVYLIEQVFLMTPFLAIAFWRKRFFLNNLKEMASAGFFWYLFVIPLIFFFILSFVKNVGLHWTASFYPFFFMLLLFFKDDILEKATEYNFYLSVIILIFVLMIFLIPVDVFKSSKKYPQIIMFMKPQQICRMIDEQSDSRILASTGYTEASVLSYHCKKDFVLFGSMSRSGRYYDYVTDFKNFDGRDFLIVSLKESDTKKFTDYFEKIDVKVVNSYDAKFYFIFGDGFIFYNYRNLYLRKILETYYSPPDFLPIKSNFFKQKYFPEF